MRPDDRAAKIADTNGVTRKQVLRSLCSHQDDIHTPFIYTRQGSAGMQREVVGAAIRVAAAGTLAGAGPSRPVGPPGVDPAAAHRAGLGPKARRQASLQQSVSPERKF